MPRSRPKRRPNIVFIMLDSLRRDHLGCYGNEKVKTPNLDRFASENLVFEDARIGSFPTNPNRSDLFTGRFTFPWRGWTDLPPGETTVAQLLQRAGYATSIIVDTPNVGRNKTFWRGFEAWNFVPGQEGSHTSLNRKVKAPYFCDLKKLRYGPEFCRDHMRKIVQRRFERDEPAAMTVRTALDWLDLNLDNLPFFLWVDTFQVHEPWWPPRPFRTMYDPGYEGQEVIAPKYGRHKLLTAREARHTRALYAGDVTFTDRWVGILLDKLRDVGLYDSSVIVITSDHGHYLGEHTTWGKPQGSLYGELTRIPLLVHHPDVKAPGRVRGLVQPPDVTAGLVDAAGLKVPEFFHGRPLWSLPRKKLRKVAVMGRLEGPLNITDGAHKHVLWNRDAGERRAIRENSLGWTGKGRDELYDLRKSPGETKNIISPRRKKAAALARSARSFLAEIGAPEEFVSRFFA